MITTLPRMLTKEPKPAKGPRAKKCACCREPFLPRMPMARACSPSCALLLVVADRKRREAKERREGLAKLKTRQKWLSEAQAEINKLVRYRDRHDPCISCDRPATWDGQWHASHYKSVGSSPALRFDLANIHKACSVCNNHLSGNIAAYTPRIIAKIGRAEFDRINGPQEVVKYTIDQIAAIKSLAVSNLRVMQKEST